MVRLPVPVVALVGLVPCRVVEAVVVRSGAVIVLVAVVGVSAGPAVVSREVLASVAEVVREPSALVAAVSVRSPITGRALRSTVTFVDFSSSSVLELEHPASAPTAARVHARRYCRRRRASAISVLGRSRR
ncbi:hypothetical protein [Haloarchaeobius sp. TZWSO28]|uniref:hypothetical protein n=1 Tax=Haloarchaeobius sp. TZWSO28 TaxID=3446119 RepID=UPI003EBE883F